MPAGPRAKDMRETKDVREMTTSELDPDSDLSGLMMKDLRDHLEQLGGDPNMEGVTKADIITAIKQLLVARNHQILEANMWRERMIQEQQQQQQQQQNQSHAYHQNGFRQPYDTSTGLSADPAPPPRLASRLTSGDNNDPAQKQMMSPPSLQSPPGTPGLSLGKSTLPTPPAKDALQAAPVPSPLPANVPTIYNKEPPYRPNHQNYPHTPPSPRLQGKGKHPAAFTETRTASMPSNQQGIGNAASYMFGSHVSLNADGEIIVQPTAPELIRRFLYPAENGDAYSQFQMGKGFMNGTGGVPKDLKLAYDWFLRSAVAGYPPAQVEVGIVLQDGLLNPNGAQGVTDVDWALAADFYKRAADQGDLEGMTKLGRCYMNGRGVKKDEILAATWYRIAAKNGNGRAQNQLGWCYWKGKGVEKNWDEAVKWYRTSAENGHPEGQFNMGLNYLYGWGGVKDPVEAINWLLMAANNNVATACLELGVCIEKGLGVQADAERAVMWYRRSAELKYDKGQEKLGSCYLNGVGVQKDPYEAVKWFQLAAEQNYYPAIGRLGIAYKIGEGVEKDPKKAVELFERAASLGCATSTTNLGNCYENGIGVPKNMKKAVELYAKAAAAGNSQAQSNLGFCYERGLGIPQNIREADRLYKLAAAKEHPQAMASLASFYELGLAGNPMDPATAAKLYNAAAKKGDPTGMFKLGRCYEMGIGLQADNALAAKWYRRAAQHKHNFAQTNLANMLLQGQGIPANPSEGVKLLMSASELGNVVAMQLLSRLYESGVYTWPTPSTPVTVLAPDQAQAKMWWMQAQAVLESQAKFNAASKAAAEKGIPLADDFHESVNRMNLS